MLTSEERCFYAITTKSRNVTVQNHTCTETRETSETWSSYSVIVGISDLYKWFILLTYHTKFLNL